MPDPVNPFVSRGGLKLAAALDAFAIVPKRYVCADLGSNMGGFTDCLLQRGAATVYAVDTGYGMLAWRLRNDPRILVLERTNALHFNPHQSIADFPGCDLVVIDLAWTRQIHALRAASAWLNAAPHASIVTLIKPHYEADQTSLKGKNKGILPDDESHSVAAKVLQSLPALGYKVLGSIVSPIRGGKGKGHTGNIEYLAHIAPLRQT